MVVTPSIHDFNASRLRMTNSSESTLAARWIAASQSDSSADPDVVRIVQRSLKGESVNESALLRALVSHAETLAAAACGEPYDAEGVG